MTRNGKKHVYALLIASCFTLLDFSLSSHYNITAFELVILIGLFVLLLRRNPLTIGFPRQIGGVLFLLALLVLIICLQVEFRLDFSGLRIALKYGEILTMSLLFILTIRTWERWETLFLAFFLYMPLLGLLKFAYNTLMWLQGSLTATALKLSLPPLVRVFVVFSCFSEGFFVMLTGAGAIAAMAMFISSRSTLLGLFIGFVGVGAQKLRTPLWHRRRFLYLSVAMAAGLLVVYTSAGRLLSLADLTRPTASNVERARLVQFSLDKISEVPFVGIGPGAFYREWSASSYVYDQSHVNLVVHNAYLQVWSQEGLFFFLIFAAVLAMILMLANNIVRKTRDLQPHRYMEALSWIVLLQVVGLVFTPLSGDARFNLAILFGFVLSAYTIVSRGSA
ncbi:MAG: O-antigen ligase family protein [Candidatus Desulfofervidaceae bacterium]|nr:O-antigen ligase family protein [Candidatus Desulfofervidaceae bacterium]